MNKSFPAYKGSEPYVFVSYSHADDELVSPELEFLHDLGINVWYDEGISPGSSWSDALARALSGSAHFIFLVTPNSVISQNCLDEITFALEKGKPLLAIHLSKTELPDGLALRLGSRQAIMKHELSTDLYRAKIEESLGQFMHKASTVAAFDSPDLSAADRIYASMAILPFENRTDDPELTLLGETIGEEITHLVGHVMRGKRFLGGSETAPYAKRGATSREIAQELRVGLVVRGNIRKAGDKVRITAELISEEGEQLWNHRFDVASDELAEREDRILEMITYGVDSSARTIQRQLAHNTPDDELGPWGLYSKGRSIDWVNNPKLREENLARLRRAIELEPHPTFLADYAFTLAEGVMDGASRDREADSALARRYAEAAASSNRCYALMSAGGAFIFLGEHDRGQRLARRGYEMAPRWGEALDAMGMMLLYCGKADEALEKYKEYSELRLPGQASPAGYIAQCHTIAGNLADGMMWAQQAIDVNSRSIVVQTTYANLLSRLDRIDEAVAAIEAIREFLPRYQIRKSITAYNRLFGTDEARNAMTEGLQKLVDLGYE